MLTEIVIAMSLDQAPKTLQEVHCPMVWRSVRVVRKESLGETSLSIHKWTQKEDVALAEEMHKYGNNMQAKRLELRAEAEVSDKELAVVKEVMLQLISELDSMRMMPSDGKDENLHMIEKYESTLRMKDSEIEALGKDRQSASVELVDFLAKGNQASNKALLEMEQISCAIICLLPRQTRKGKPSDY